MTHRELFHAWLLLIVLQFVVIWMASEIRDIVADGRGWRPCLDWRWLLWLLIMATILSTVVVGMASIGTHA